MHLALERTPRWQQIPYLQQQAFRASYGWQRNSALTIHALEDTAPLLFHTIRPYRPYCPYKKRTDIHLNPM